MELGGGEVVATGVTLGNWMKVLESKELSTWVENWMASTTILSD